jgi:hypothetical protein
MRLHRYLSLFVAPAMLFFAISGAWQAFRLNDDKKDGSYHAPPVLKLLSQAHKAEHLAKEGAAGNLFRFGELTLATVFVVTALVGIVMAFRLARPRWRVWACLAAGIALPVSLALMALR